MFNKDFIGRNIRIDSNVPNAEGLIKVSYETASGYNDSRLILPSQVGEQRGPSPMPEPVDWPREGRSPSYAYEKAFIAACYGVTL